MTGQRKNKTVRWFKGGAFQMTHNRKVIHWPAQKVWHNAKKGTILPTNWKVQAGWLSNPGASPNAS